MIVGYFDGAWESQYGDNGSMGMGAYIEEDGKEIFRIRYGLTVSELHPYTSVNIAEYLALMELLKWQQQNKHIDLIRGDSELVIRQANRQMKIRKGHYVSVALACQKLIRPSNRFEWVRRHMNEKADMLSKEGLFLVATRKNSPRAPVAKYEQQKLF